MIFTIERSESESESIQTFCSTDYMHEVSKRFTPENIQLYPIIATPKSLYTLMACVTRLTSLLFAYTLIYSTVANDLIASPQSRNDTQKFQLTIRKRLKNSHKNSINAHQFVRFN